jgi:hypothetical protein
MARQMWHTLRVRGIAALVMVVSLTTGAGTVQPVAAQASPGPITPPFIILAQIASGSSPGLTTAGPFSAVTKLPRVGTYVTIRWVLDPPAADQRIEVFVATKGPSGTWSTWTPLTARLTDSHGIAYFHWRLARPGWLSVQGRFAGAVHLTAARAPAVQVRWR